MMNLHSECTAGPRSAALPLALGEMATARRGDVSRGGIVVLARPLAAREWDKVRAFVRGTSRESLRARFGQAIDFADDRTLKRFFGVDGVNAEMIWVVEEGGAIAAIAHLAPLSAAEAEIALIVRSDRARRGIGEKLFRLVLARAARNFATVSAVVLRDNVAMLRLARKVGLEPRKSFGLTVELALDLGRAGDAGVFAGRAGAPIDTLDAAIRQPF